MPQEVALYAPNGLNNRFRHCERCEQVSWKGLQDWLEEHHSSNNIKRSEGLGVEPVENGFRCWACWKWREADYPRRWSVHVPLWGVCQDNSMEGNSWVCLGGRIYDFLEIRNGENALFWQDSWQQQAPLATLEELKPLWHALQPDIFIWVNNIWRMSDGNLPWCNWKTQHSELHLSRETDIQAWWAYANHRKIPNWAVPNILRLGHSTAGNVSVKEAY